MSARIPALTLWRPWPTLILHAGKDVENRPWATTYRGPLLIHAGARFQHGIEAIGYRSDGQAVEWITMSTDPDDYPMGIVGVVDLTGICGCARLGGCSIWAMMEDYHWQLSNPRPFDEPVPCRGRQQLWYPTGDAGELVAQQLAKVGANP